MAVWWVCFAALLLLSPGLLQGEPEVEEIISVKNVQPLGGWTGLSTRGNDAKRMAQFAELMFGSEDGQCRYRTTKIHKAEMQVTNGFNYRLKLEMENTGCEKEVILCDILIFEDMRGKTKTMQEKTCTPANN